MTSPTFNIGKDYSVVFMGPFGRVDFSHVTMFDAKPVIKTVKVDPLNTQPIARDIPGGWDFNVTIERANANADSFQALQETAFWAGVSIPVGAMYVYISETDGSTTTWQYTNVVMHLEDAGSASQEKSVSQKIKGFASQRIQVG